MYFYQKPIDIMLKSDIIVNVAIPLSTQTSTPKTSPNGPKCCVGVAQ